MRKHYKKTQHGTAEGTQIYKLNVDLKQILQSIKWKVEFVAEKKPPDNKNYQTYGTKSQITFNYKNSKIKVASSFGSNTVQAIKKVQIV